MPNPRLARVTFASSLPRPRLAVVTAIGDGAQGTVTPPRPQLAEVSVVGATASTANSRPRLTSVRLTGGTAFAPRARLARVQLAGGAGVAARPRLTSISFGGSVNTGPPLTLSTQDNECFAGQTTDATAYVEPNAPKQVDHYVWSILSNSTGKPAVLTPSGNSTSNVATLVCPISLTGGTVVVQCIAVGLNGASSPARTLTYTVFPAAKRMKIDGQVVGVAVFRRSEGS